MWLHKKKVSGSKIQKRSPYVVQKVTYIKLPGSDDYWKSLSNFNGKLFLNAVGNKIALVRDGLVRYLRLNGNYEFLYVPIGTDYTDFDAYFVEVSNNNKRKTIMFSINDGKLITGETEPYETYLSHEFTKDGLKLSVLDGDSLLEILLTYNGKYQLKEKVEGEHRNYDRLDDIMDIL